MSKLDEILNELMEFCVAVAMGESPTEGKPTKQQIKDLFLELIGEDLVRRWDDEYHMCSTCDFQPTDDTTLCLCEVRNALKAKLRKKVESL